MDNFEEGEEDELWGFNKKNNKDKPKNPFDSKTKGAFDDLDDLDFGFDNKKNKKVKQEEAKVENKADTDNGLFVDNDFGDDFENEYEDDFGSDDKHKSNIFEDKSASDKKQQNQPAKKDEAKEEMTGEKKENEEELEPEDQAKMIIDQFNLIYENDPELKQLLGSDISNLSLEEKYQILTAYMNGGGVRGLLSDDTDDEKAIEAEFDQIYAEDPKLRQLIGTDPSNLNIKEKYQILMAYKKGGGVQGLTGDEEEESVIEHEGKKFKRVQIEDENQDYLMDEEGNIYDTEFNFIGQANDDEAA